MFTAEMPYERAPILDFVMKVASTTDPGTKVIDLGAGDAPYRELFSHASYVTSDWAESLHVAGRRSDMMAVASDLPISSATVGLVLCTQVLEHIAAPAEVLAECRRVLKPGGRIALTVPLVWQLHELPHDYYRYTCSGIEHLLKEAGFVNIEICARNDSFTTLAQLMLNLGATMGHASDGLDSHREDAQGVLVELAEQVARLAPLDVERRLPLGYTAIAHRP